MIVVVLTTIMMTVPATATVKGRPHIKVNLVTTSAEVGDGYALFEVTFDVTAKNGNILIQSATSTDRTLGGVVFNIKGCLNATYASVLVADTPQTTDGDYVVARNTTETFRLLVFIPNQDGCEFVGIVLKFIGWESVNGAFAHQVRPAHKWTTPWVWLGT